jgi:hypothetical protein
MLITEYGKPVHALGKAGCLEAESQKSDMQHVITRF